MASADSQFFELSNPVVCVVGPTASGKTDVAQLVASSIGGEVVSADSMQVYRGMDIGTGKLPAELRIVEHYGFDLVDPGEPFSASLFLEYARDAFRRIDARGKRAVLAGGTGFYVRAAIDDYRFPQGEQVDNPVREGLNLFLEQNGTQALWERLHAADPDSAALIHPNNAKRVVRALEMLELEGMSYAQQHKGLATMQQLVPAVFFGLSVTPELLNQRIDARVDSMIAAGLVDEVKGLLDAGFEAACTAKDAIGYKEIVAALRGECSIDEAVESIKRATRRYAKRQRTWWRGDQRIHWIDADDGDAKRIARVIVDAVQG